MKQIKTIMQPAGDSFSVGAFDKLVNDAIAEGWDLVKRDALKCYTSGHMLYAELVRFVITEEEKCCDNCRYADNDARLFPCCDCEDASHWEAGE